MADTMNTMSWADMEENEEFMLKTSRESWAKVVRSNIVLEEASQASHETTSTNSKIDYTYVYCCDCATRMKFKSEQVQFHMTKYGRLPSRCKTCKNERNNYFNKKQ